MNYECKCICHSSSNVKHVVNCCTKCVYCYKNIISGKIKEHLKEEHPIIVLVNPNLMD